MWISWLGGVADNNPWRAASPRSRPLLPHTLRTLRDRSNKGAKVTIKRGSQKQGSWHWISSSLSREREIKKFRWMKSICDFEELERQEWKFSEIHFQRPTRVAMETAEMITFRYDCLQWLDVGRLLLDFPPAPRLTNPRKMRRIQRTRAAKYLRYGIRVFKNVFGTDCLVHKSERKEKSYKPGKAR